VLGTATVARAVNSAIRVIGVQAEGAPALYLSWRAGRRVEIETIATFAEGLATRQPFEMPLELLPRLVDELMLVSDADLRRAIVTLLRTTRQLAEGAGAAPLAAAILRRDELRGKTIGLVISGGNITVEQLREILDE
jgi:threonine dehydratase